MYTSNKMLSPREITNDRKHFIDNLDRIWTMQPNGTRSFVNPNRGSLPRVAEYFRPIRGRFRECVACRRRRQAVERREILKACGTLALVHKNLPPYWLFYSLTYIHSEIHATRTTPDDKRARSLQRLHATTAARDEMRGESNKKKRIFG